jgi:hypothetical protein
MTGRQTKDDRRWRVVKQRPNKALKLTSAEPIERSQLNAGVVRTTLGNSGVE